MPYTYMDTDHTKIKINVDSTGVDKIFLWYNEPLWSECASGFYKIDIIVIEECLLQMVIFWRIEKLIRNLICHHFFHNG